MRVPPWAGLVPFFLWSGLFLLLPSAVLLSGAFFDRQGVFTWQNILDLAKPKIVSSYLTTLELSAASAAGGLVVGLALAWAATRGGFPRVRGVLATFSGVASNFAGVPLAFAFIATLGRMGLVTALFRSWGWDPYETGFNLYSFAGLTLTYLYFQIPLMVLLITPALEGLRREWGEAAASLGAGRGAYLARVALPLLAPSLLSAFLLLFGNAFGAYATAYALTGGLLNLVPILIGAQIRGDVLHNPGLGYALALGMVTLMAVAIAISVWTQRLAERWGTR